MEEAPCRRHHEGGIMEEASWRKHHGGGIMEEASWRREASQRHLGDIWKASGKHLGGIWEAPGWLWGSSGVSGSSWAIWGVF